VRRLAPRPLGDALARVTRRLEPLTLLARVQRAWRETAGEVVAAEAEPVSERAGEVTIACRSAVWAQELALLAPDLRRQLNDALGTAPEAPAIKALKFVVESTSRRP
jgi:predicted nucleic acid-binding Zn ribbon protein